VIKKKKEKLKPSILRIKKNCFLALRVYIKRFLEKKRNKKKLFSQN